MDHDLMKNVTVGQFGLEECAETPQVLPNRPPKSRYFAAADFNTEQKMDHNHLGEVMISQGLSKEERIELTSTKYDQLIDYSVLRLILKGLIKKLEEKREKVIQEQQHEWINTGTVTLVKEVSQDITGDAVKWYHQASSSHQSEVDATSFQWLAIKPTEKNTTVMILNGPHKHQLAKILRYNIYNYKVEVQLEDNKEVVIVRCDDICMYN